MSQNDSTTEPADDSTSLPTFELSCAVDTRENPSRVTVYAPDGERGTRWISIDSDHAVDLSDIA